MEMQKQTLAQKLSRRKPKAPAAQQNPGANPASRSRSKDNSWKTQQETEYVPDRHLYNYTENVAYYC